MGTVHRNGHPPKRFQKKFLLSMPDHEWFEDKLIQWAKENCSGYVQYDVIVFQGPQRHSAKTIEVTVWFEKKKDAMLFKLSWEPAQ